MANSFLSRLEKLEAVAAAEEAVSPIGPGGRLHGPYTRILAGWRFGDLPFGHAPKGASGELRRHLRKALGILRETAGEFWVWIDDGELSAVGTSSANERWLNAQGIDTENGNSIYHESEPHHWRLSKPFPPGTASEPA